MVLLFGALRNWEHRAPGRRPLSLHTDVSLLAFPNFSGPQRDSSKINETSNLKKHIKTIETAIEDRRGVCLTKPAIHHGLVNATEVCGVLQVIALR